MAQVMAQATSAVIPSIMPLARDASANAAFHSMNVLGVSKPSLLEHEAFPGELAALRAQVTQSTKHSFSPRSIESTHPFHNSTSEKQTPSYNLLADQLIEVMPTGLVMLDGNGIVVKINQVARNLLDEPILGQPWFNVIARSFNPREDDWHEISLKDGRRVKLEITSLGSQPGQLIMITDLTETRLLQDKLAQMQRLSSLGKMVSTLAHQIRTPLSAAILYSENLSSNKLAETSRLKFQGKLNDRLHDLEQQVNDMLLFSKSGKEQVVASIDVGELINTTVSSMDALLDKANTQVKVQLPEDELYILGNKSALTGAIQNLLHNSLQAISTHKVIEPQINIQVYRQANHIYLSFKDNGPGIDTKIIDKVFQPFYTSSSKGTGLGLAVVKSVVGAHQGEVSLLNETNAGAHFVIKLPLLEQGNVMTSCSVGETHD
ncbi:PAS domain-containing sensor histidine kinase [Colwellia sp. 75C3]|uniref:sensor histidine kinase n=1 Tax=Colwellia sp. 75C3 TaxID=888425 RepID=UPI000C32C6DF|nr:HAMP domain-containing sensor histidine kinase [Colwellia sp. 75C3]PKG81138.1 PAS domain-containing sensor histidine kinase [Colwellia sp. 75C3]